MRQIIIGTFVGSKKALSRADAVTAAVIRLMTDSKKALSRLGALSAAAAAVT